MMVKCAPEGPQSVLKWLPGELKMTPWGAPRPSGGQKSYLFFSGPVFGPSLGAQRGARRAQKSIKTSTFNSKLCSRGCFLSLFSPCVFPLAFSSIFWSLFYENSMENHRVFFKASRFLPNLANLENHAFS